NITIEYRGRELDWREIPAPAKPCVPAVQAAREGVKKLRLATTKRTWVPAADHPWRQAARRAAEQKAAREAVAVRS
ncbi:MAG TPA: hypothetical protein VM709_13930, partial [Candidatus Sulfotelmatobacter sp.]|nr:hypothetical protein [Candidatus Sulfotelmatobacter sp.]